MNRIPAHLAASILAPDSGLLATVNAASWSVGSGDENKDTPGCFRGRAQTERGRGEPYISLYR